VSAATADGLVGAILSFEECERQTNHDWTPTGPQIVHGPIDIEEEEEGSE
jgi:hypothetical protein